MDKIQTTKEEFLEELHARFDALPPLGSADYLAFIENATALELPGGVLARAYRQLADACDPAAETTLARLLRTEYLAAVRFLAKRFTAGGRDDYDDDDLFQATIVEIVRVLPTKRGSMAEEAWVSFCRQRFYDALRSLAGRRRKKTPDETATPTKISIDDENVDEAIRSLRDPHQFGVKVTRIEILIRRTVSEIADPFVQQVAADQFGEDPSPISSAPAGSTRPPLTEQLGASRFKVSRALRAAKAKLAHALLEEDDLGVDVEWVRQYLFDAEKEKR